MTPKVQAFLDELRDLQRRHGLRLEANPDARGIDISLGDALAINHAYPVFTQRRHREMFMAGH